MAFEVVVNGISAFTSASFSLPRMRRGNNRPTVDAIVGKAKCGILVARISRANRPLAESEEYWELGELEDPEPGEGRGWVYDAETGCEIDNELIRKGKL